MLCKTMVMEDFGKIGAQNIFGRKMVDKTTANVLSTIFYQKYFERQSFLSPAIQYTKLTDMCRIRLRFGSYKFMPFIRGQVLQGKLTKMYMNKIIFLGLNF